MLAAIIFLYTSTGSTELIIISENFDTKSSSQYFLWLAFFCSFAVKLPMWPVHTWLPDAHVEAPTSGSVILAAVLLKMGGYGFLRFSLPLFPEASHYFAPFMFTLSLIAIIYTSLVAYVQEDIKKLIAYSSVAHMGFVTLGIFTFSLIAEKLKIAEISTNISKGMLLSAGILGGIGFTMSIFVSNLAFTNESHINLAKISIISASVIAASLGYVGFLLLKKAK